MKLTNTLIALALLAVLGGALFYLNKHPSTNTAADAIPKQKLFSFQPDQVQEFTIQVPDQAPATFRRVAGKQKEWEVVSPAGVPADSSQVQSFVDAIPKFQYTPLESQTPASLAEYGLDQPKKTFKFQLAQGQPVTLSVGKDNPGGYAKYGTSSSSPGLFLLDSADTKDLVDKTLFDFRDKRMLPFALDKVQRIEMKYDLAGKAFASEIENAKKLHLPVKVPRIVMTKQPDGKWALTEPPVRTNFGATDYFISNGLAASISSTEDENPKSLSTYGLDHPQIVLDVTAPDGTHTLLIGNQKEPPKTPEPADKKEPPQTHADLGYYAKNSQWAAVFTIAKTVYDQIDQIVENYRNRSLFDFDSNARRVEIQGPDGELRLEKKGDDWFKGANATDKLDANKVNDFLSAIHDLRIENFTQDQAGHFGEYGLDKPWMRIKVTFGEANKEETIVFAPKNKKFYGARVNEPSVYEMLPNGQDTIEKKLKAVSP